MESVVSVRDCAASSARDGVIGGVDGGGGHLRKPPLVGLCHEVGESATALNKLDKVRHVAHGKSLQIFHLSSQVVVEGLRRKAGAWATQWVGKGDCYVHSDALASDCFCDQEQTPLSSACP